MTALLSVPPLNGQIQLMGLQQQTIPLCRANSIVRYEAICNSHPNRRRNTTLKKGSMIPAVLWHFYRYPPHSQVFLEARAILSLRSLVCKNSPLT